jgi:amidase
MAIGLAAGSIGTETDGSIVLPSSRNNIVGIKPTVGLVSRAGGTCIRKQNPLPLSSKRLVVIPLSRHQDTAGPMCRSVTDAAILLSIIAGPDPRDEVTLHQPGVRLHYTDALDVNALKGKRLGIPRGIINDVDEAIAQSFDAALRTLITLGAEIIDPADLPSSSEMLKPESEALVMTVDFKNDLNRYLSELVDVPTGVRSLAQVIDFNEKHADLELPLPYYTDQSQ